MTAETPCSSPANSPDDWFIEKDGKQYPDDALLSEEEVNAASCDQDGNLLGSADEIEAAVEVAEAEALKAALRRRRHAKDKCFVECYFRTQCLSLALGDTPPTHGIYGGYYREELDKIRDLRDEREQVRRAAASHQTDTASGE